MGCSTRESQLSLNWISAISPHGLAMGSATHYRSAPSILVDDCVHAAKWRVYGAHTGAITTTSGLTVLTKSNTFLTVDGLVKSVPAMTSKLWLLRNRLFTTNQHVKLRPPRISTISTPHGPRTPWCLLYISSMSQAQ